jgi:hypothetical protein
MHKSQLTGSTDLRNERSSQLTPPDKRKRGDDCCRLSDNENAITATTSGDAVVITVDDQESWR